MAIASPSLATPMLPRPLLRQPLETGTCLPVVTTTRECMRAGVSELHRPPRSNLLYYGILVCVYIHKHHVLWEINRKLHSTTPSPIPPLCVISISCRNTFLVCHDPLEGVSQHRIVLSVSCRKNIANDIEPYWVMWVLSVLDFADVTGSTALLAELRPWVETRLAHARVLYTQAASTGAALRWSRDDDRLGFGFEFPDQPEAQRAFRALTIEACHRYGLALAAMGNKTGGALYTGYAAAYMRDIRKDASWTATWGMHASADLINTRLLTAAEEKLLLDLHLSDPLQLPSLSNFESYFVLRALSFVHAPDVSLALVRRCVCALCSRWRDERWVLSCEDCASCEA